MADGSVVAALKRFFSRAEVEEAYRGALAAYSERVTEVVITSSSMSGESSSGEIKGDPKELMDACEEVLVGWDAVSGGVVLAQGAVSTDFSRRRVGT